MEHIQITIILWKIPNLNLYFPKFLFDYSLLTLKLKTNLKYIENNSLDIFTHNKTISKSCDSYRIDKTKKEYLKNLRRR